MLRLKTPNLECAALTNISCSILGDRINSLAISEDYETEVVLHRRYSERNKRRYVIFLFYNSNIRDGSIYDLRDEKINDRIGLLAPISAFSSLAHNRSQDEYFEAVASSVFWELLFDKDNISTPADLHQNGEYEISDFYPDNTAALVIREDAVSSFNVNRYIPAFFSYGYIKYNPNRKINSLWNFKDLPKGKELRVQPVGDLYLGDGYIESLYTDMLPYEENPLAGFVLQYQVLELLMHFVFVDRFSQFGAVVGSFSGTASDLREIFSAVQEVSSERDRIRFAIEDKKINHSEFKDLSESCKLILTSSSRQPKSEQLSDLIYDIRNLIFHNYRSIPHSLFNKVSDINKQLLHLIPKLLASKT